MFIEPIFYTRAQNPKNYVVVLFDAYSKMDDYEGSREKELSKIVEELRHIIQYKLDIAYMVECIVKARIKDAMEQK